MKIGVFDSGIGGKSFISPIRLALPQAKITYADDRANVPYGTREPAEIIQLTDQAIQPLLECDVIVIACNTATAVALPSLRRKYPAMPFVGLEPMVKPASEQTKSGKVIVCATPATLTSATYNSLKTRYGSAIKIYEPDCSDWAGLIERNALSVDVIEKDLHPGLEAGADTVVLACTHYHWIEDEIKNITAGKATVIEPTAAVIRQLKRVLSV